MKNQILKIFKDHKNEFISGERLSEDLGISRNAVWKAIKSLENMGYEFVAKNKKGYMLTKCPDVPYAAELKPFLKPELSDVEIIYKNEIDSTNNYAKKLAIDSLSEKTVVIAKNQSGARGKLGSKWNSDGGLYMSVILRPEISLLKAMDMVDNIIKRIAGVIDESFSVQTEIENNDILLDGNKICGVLIEFAGEVDRLEYMAVGIGIKIKELENSGYTLGSVVKITADIINKLYS